MSHAFRIAGRRPSFTALKLTRLDFIHITPHPGFSGLNRTNQRMLRLVEMFSGVLVLRRVAAAHVSTDETQAQVDPGIAELNALLTNVRGRGSDFDLIEVGACCRHRFLISPGKVRFEPGQVTSVM